MAMSTRDRLIASALEVFLEQGYAGARVQEIARRAGLTTGAIYANFSGKGELLAEALSVAPAAEIEAIRATVGARTLEDLERIIVEGLSSTPIPVHSLIVEAWGVALHDDVDAVAIRKGSEAMAEGTRECLEEALRTGELDAGVDVDALDLLLRAIAMGAIAAKATGMGPTVDREAAARLVARLFQTVRTAH
jgi:AcrR family transcriptional regulator